LWQPPQQFVPLPKPYPFYDDVAVATDVSMDSDGGGRRRHSGGVSDAAADAEVTSTTDAAELSARLESMEELDRALEEEIALLAAQTQSPTGGSQHQQPRYQQQQQQQQRHEQQQQKKQQHERQQQYEQQQQQRQQYEQQPQLQQHRATAATTAAVPGGLPLMSDSEVQSLLDASLATAVATAADGAAPTPPAVSSDRDDGRLRMLQRALIRAYK
jgi:flagellar motor protein MotB